MAERALGAGPGFEPGNLRRMRPARFHNCAIPHVRRRGLEPRSTRIKSPMHDQLCERRMWCPGPESNRQPRLRRSLLDPSTCRALVLRVGFEPTSIPIKSRAHGQAVLPERGGQGGS